MDQQETWRAIPGSEGRYEVSDLGRVRSLVRGGRILKPAKSKTGYLMVAPVIDGRNKPRRVHHLVLLAFVGPRPDGAEGCHNNDVPGDNRLVNLRWDTRAANVADRKARGYFRSTEFFMLYRTLVPAQVMAILEERNKRRASVIAAEYGISRHTVYNIWSRRIWKEILRPVSA